MLTKSIVWINSDNTISVMKPAEAARLPGETDADFLARIAAKDAAGMDVQILDDSAIAANAEFVAAEAIGVARSVANAKATALTDMTSMTAAHAVLLRNALRLVMATIQAKQNAKINEIIAAVNAKAGTSIQPIAASKWSDLFAALPTILNAETDPTQ